MGKNINVCLPLMHPLLGTCPTTQTCDLTGNQTSDPLVCSLELNPLTHTRQGYILMLSSNPLHSLTSAITFHYAV